MLEGEFVYNEWNFNLEFLIHTLEYMPMYVSVHTQYIMFNS